MAGKRVHSDDDLHCCQSKYEQRCSVSARHDQLGIVEQLMGIIDQQIKVFGPGYFRQIRENYTNTGLY